MTNLTAEAQVRDLIHGRWKAQALAAALRLGIPEQLRDRPRTVPELAEAIRVEPDALGRLMRLMVAIGVFAKHGDGAYAHTDESRRLLDDHPQTLARDARYTLSATIAGAWGHLEQATRTGTTGFEQSGHESLDGYLAAHGGDRLAIEAYRSGVAGATLRAILASDLLPAAGTVVVVGARNAAMVTALGRTRPALTCRLWAGNLRDGAVDDALPTGATMYLLPHVLHDLADTAALALLREVAGAMTSTSTTLVVAAIADDRDGHLLAAYLDVQQALTGPGRERNQDEHRRLFEAAGLAVSGFQELAGRPGIGVFTARTPAASGP